MPDISKITLPSGTSYDIKDATARELIESIQTSITGAMSYVGVTTTALTDGASTATIVINGANHTASAGDVAIYDDREFVFSGTVWNEFGSTGSLKALAFKDSASGSYTPAGTVSKPTFTGSSSNVTITASANSSGNYTPAGTVSTPTFTGSSTQSSGKFTPSGSVSVTTNGTTNPNRSLTTMDLHLLLRSGRNPPEVA